MKRMRFAALLLLLLLLPFAAFADLFDELRHIDPAKHSKRVGIEVEMSGLSQERIFEIVHALVGGKISEREMNFTFKNPRTGQQETLRSRLLKINHSKIGNLRVKLEDNSTELDEISHQAKNSRIIELWSAPLELNQVTTLQQVLDALLTEGAEGTRPDLAVSIQVNVEIGKGDPAQIQTDQVLSILRNYLSQENRRDISSRLGVPEIRQKYLGLPVPGFMKLINDPNYRPSWRRLYYDSMYRSILEWLKDPEAWTISDGEASRRVHQFVMKEDVEPLLPVLKWNFVRYSSLMMFMGQDEWLTKFLISTKLFQANPILEFREPNNDFQLSKTVDWVLQFVAAAENYPVFNAGVLENSRRENKPGSTRGLRCQGRFLPRPGR